MQEGGDPLLPPAFTTRKGVTSDGTPVPPLVTPPALERGTIMRHVVRFIVCARAGLSVSAGVLALTAVDGCKGQKSIPKTGTILVSAKNITGRHAAVGSGSRERETGAFDDAGTCVAASSASKSVISGRLEAPLAITHRQLCRIYLADDGATDSSYIKDCTPGLRRRRGARRRHRGPRAGRTSADQGGDDRRSQAKENASQQTTIDTTPNRPTSTPC